MLILLVILHSSLQFVFVYNTFVFVFNLTENENRKVHIRYCTLHYFYHRKSAAETELFARFIVSILSKNLGSKNFEMKISNFCGRSQKIKDEDLKVLLVEDAA